MTADRDLAKACAELRPKVLRIEDLMVKIGHPVFICEVWRYQNRQAELWAIGRDAEGSIVNPSIVVTYSRPGSSRHEVCLADGTPASEAVDFAFSGSNPFSDRHPWGVLRAVAVEVVGLRAISTWNPNTQRFEGDLGHFQIA